MPKYERIEIFPEMTANELFNAAVNGLEQSGFEIWKKRPVAFLFLSKKKIDGIDVTNNLAVQFGSPTTLKMTLSAEKLDESGLSKIADDTISNIKAAARAKS